MYGIVNHIEFVKGVLTRTPIGYVVGKDKIIMYNSKNEKNNYVIEVFTETIPKDLNEIDA